MANSKKKSKTAAPARSAAKAPAQVGAQLPNGEECKFITRTVHAIVTMASQECPPQPAAGQQSITIRSHEPGESVPCLFTVRGGCSTGGRGITVTLSYLDPTTMTTVPVATGSTSCVGGRWSYTFDLNGSGLPAGTTLFVDAQIDRYSPFEPLINAYMNLYTSTACPIIATARSEKK
jgi:hypothetical protein